MVPVLYEILSMVRVKPCQVIRWHVPAIRRVWANDGLVDYFHIYNLNFFKDRCIFHVIVPSTDGDCLISDHWTEIERTRLFLESWIKLYISSSFLSRIELFKISESRKFCLRRWYSEERSACSAGAVGVPSKITTVGYDMVRFPIVPIGIYQ